MRLSGLLDGHRNRSRPLAFDDAIAAFGRLADLGWRTDEVPVGDVVGTVARTTDFDEEFRPADRRMHDRWQRVERALRSGAALPPVELVQLGELYFVVDGHHRVSAARSLDHDTILARVHRICTVAFAMCCLRARHLASKAAERAFLEQVPLPDDVRRDLWLDDPVDWVRLTDDAHAWGWRRSHVMGQLLDPPELAQRWWDEQVVPVVERARASGDHVASRDIGVYAAMRAAVRRTAVS